MKLFNKSKVDTSNSAENKKPNKDSASKGTKKKENNKSLYSWIFQPVIISSVCFGLCYFLIELLYLKPLDVNYQKQLADSHSKSIQRDVNQYINEQLIWVGALSNQNGLAIEATTKPAFKQLKPELQDIQVFDLESLNGISAKGTLSFASIDLLRRVASGKQAEAEAFLQEKQWYFQIAAKTSHDGKPDKARVMLAVFDLSALKDRLKVNQQVYGGGISILIEGVRQPVIKVGNGLDDQSSQLSTRLTDWNIQYSPPENMFKPADRVLVWSLFGSVLVLFIVLLVVILRINMKALKTDLLRAGQLTTKAIDSNAGFQNSFHYGEVFTMANAIVGQARLILSKYKKQAAKVTAKPNELAESEQDEPLFDDDLFDLDAIDDVEPADQALSESAIEGQSSEAIVSEVERIDVEVSPSIFREYDIRGVVDDTLSTALVELIGKAIGSEALAQGQKRLCVAYDGRLSSPGYSETLIKGIVSTGVDAILIGQVPTPILYFATHHFETGSGVMITGSHNPGNYNGFKIMIAGTTLSGEAIQKLYQRIDLQDFAQGQGQRSEETVVRAYLDAILNDIAVAAPLKVVLDAGNGVSGSIAPDLIEELGCEVIPLHCEVDGNFPNHHPDPGKPENLQDLIAAVKEHQADIGIAFDGDGDRIGVVTNTGKIIWPDRLLMLFAKDVVSRNPGADIIYDVKSSRRLNGLISSYGGRPVMWKTGHSLIKAKMKETGALLAGEMSGHIFFKERWYGFDDGLYSAARMLEILGVEDKTSEAVFAEFPEDVSTPEINVSVEESAKFSIVEKLCERKEQFVGGNVSTIDGLRVDFPNGWGLCRASNTTPTLVLRFEADDEDALSEIKAKFVMHLKEIEPTLDCNF